jgi:hypothetical protein
LVAQSFGPPLGDGGTLELVIDLARQVVRHGPTANRLVPDETPSPSADRSPPASAAVDADRLAHDELVDGTVPWVR